MLAQDSASSCMVSLKTPALNSLRRLYLALPIDTSPVLESLKLHCCTSRGITEIKKVLHPQSNFDNTASALKPTNSLGVLTPLHIGAALVPEVPHDRDHSSARSEVMRGNRYESVMSSQRQKKHHRRSTLQPLTHDTWHFIHALHESSTLRAAPPVVTGPCRPCAADATQIKFCSKCESTHWKKNLVTVKVDISSYAHVHGMPHCACFQAMVQIKIHSESSYKSIHDVEAKLKRLTN